MSRLDRQQEEEGREFMRRQELEQIEAAAEEQFFTETDIVKYREARGDKQ